MMNDVDQAAALSALRTILGILGGVLVAHGVVDSKIVEPLIGAAMAIVPIVWGVLQKYAAEKKTQAREAIALNVGIQVADRNVGATPPVPAAVVPAILNQLAPAKEPTP